MVPRLMLGGVVAFTLGFLALGHGSAEAAPVTPNGLCGAKNMMNDAAKPHMLEAMDEHTALQGDLGMRTAVLATRLRLIC